MIILPEAGIRRQWRWITLAVSSRYRWSTWSNNNNINKITLSSIVFYYQDLPNIMRTTDRPRKNVNNPRHAHYDYQLQTDTSQRRSVTDTNFVIFLLNFSIIKQNKAWWKKTLLKRDKEWFDLPFRCWFHIVALPQTTSKLTCGWQK